MIDTAKLRALLAPLSEEEDVYECRQCHAHLDIEEPDDLAPLCDGCAQELAIRTLPALLDELEALRAHAADVNHYLRAILDGKPASICSFCHHLSENNPEAMRAHVLACEKHPLRAAVTAWREATGCDGPGEAEQLARDAVVVREGHWDAALAERAAWRTATGCDTPEEAGEVKRRWEEEDAEQAAELARLRELEAAVLELDASSGGDDVWDLDGSDEERRARAAIAACRAARKPPGPEEHYYREHLR